MSDTLKTMSMGVAIARTYAGPLDSRAVTDNISTFVTSRTNYKYVGQIVSDTSTGKVYVITGEPLDDKSPYTYRELTSSETGKYLGTLYKNDTKDDISLFDITKIPTTAKKDDFFVVSMDSTETLEIAHDPDKKFNPTGGEGAKLAIFNQSKLVLDSITLKEDGSAVQSATFYVVGGISIGSTSSSTVWSFNGSFTDDSQNLIKLEASSNFSANLSGPFLCTIATPPNLPAGTTVLFSFNDRWGECVQYKGNKLNPEKNCWEAGETILALYNNDTFYVLTYLPTKENSNSSKVSPTFESGQNSLIIDIGKGLSTNPFFWNVGEKTLVKRLYGYSQDASLKVTSSVEKIESTEIICNGSLTSSTENNVGSYEFLNLCLYKNAAALATIPIYNCSRSNSTMICFEGYFNEAYYVLEVPKGGYGSIDKPELALLYIIQNELECDTTSEPEKIVEKLKEHLTKGKIMVHGKGLYYAIDLKLNNYTTYNSK